MPSPVLENLPRPNASVIRALNIYFDTTLRKCKAQIIFFNGMTSPWVEVTNQAKLTDVIAKCWHEWNEKPEDREPPHSSPFIPTPEPAEDDTSG